MSADRPEHHDEPIRFRQFGEKAGLDKAAAEPPQPGLPPKTLLLTFDDGPHPRYTEEIKAILRQYGVPAVFFAKSLGFQQRGFFELPVAERAAVQSTPQVKF